VIDVPETDKPRRTDHKLCAHCGGSAAGCRSHAWLSGRMCCAGCTGDHDINGRNDT
jgi:hypothetical protein